MATAHKESSRDSTLKQMSQKIRNGGFIFRGQFVQTGRTRATEPFQRVAVGQAIREIKASS